MESQSEQLNEGHSELALIEVDYSEQLEYRCAVPR